MTVERREQYDSGSRYRVREYRVTSAAMEACPTTAHRAPNPEADAQQAGADFCGYSCGYSAAMESAMENPAAANATDSPVKCQHTYAESEKEENTVSMGTHSRIAA